LNTYCIPPLTVNVALPDFLDCAKIKNLLRLIRLIEHNCFFVASPKALRRISEMGRGTKTRPGNKQGETMKRAANICEGLVTLAFTYVTGMAGIVTDSRPCLCRRTFPVLCVNLFPGNCSRFALKDHF